MFKDIDTFYFDNADYGKEKLIWIDNFDYICYIKLKPYFVRKTHVHQEPFYDFCIDYDRWDALAKNYYETVTAKRIIYRASQPWLTKPITNDGKVGLYAHAG